MLAAANCHVDGANGTSIRELVRQPRSLRSRWRISRSCARSSRRTCRQQLPGDRARVGRAGTRLANKLYSFAGLAFAADTQDQRIQALLGRIQQFMAEMENRTLFFSLWWKDLDEANVQRLMDASRRLPLLPGSDAQVQAAHPERGRGEGRQPEERDRFQRLDHPVRCHHQPLHLQGGGGWPDQGTDPRRTDVPRPPGRTRICARAPTRSSTASTPRTARSWDRCTRPWCATGATRT